jgi:hypothetical protein
MRIPNRLAAVLVVLVFAVAIGGGFYWLFSYNTATLVVTTDPVGALVTIERERVGLYERIANPEAKFEDIPALEYTLAVTASGYSSDRRTITLKKNETNEIGVRLVPRAFFEEVKSDTALEPRPETATADADTATGAATTSTGTTGSGSTATGTTAAQSETVTLPDDEAPADSSGLMLREKPVFEILTASGTSLYRHGRSATGAVVHADEGFVSFREGDIPYVYDLEYDRAVPVIGWSGSIVSVRRTPDRDRWIIHGDTESATYSVRDNSLLPHPFFNDYIYLDSNTVLGIIDNADTARWNRLGEKSSNRDAVVLLDVTTKSYRILSQDRDDLTSIEYSPAGPVVYDSEGKRFLIKNFR